MISFETTRPAALGCGNYRIGSPVAPVSVVFRVAARNDVGRPLTPCKEASLTDPKAGCVSLHARWNLTLGRHTIFKRFRFELHC